MRVFARQWMIRELRTSPGDYTDANTGEVNLPGLAEATAAHFDREEWLDDPDHWIWELPIEVGGFLGLRLPGDRCAS